MAKAFPKGAATTRTLGLTYQVPGTGSLAQNTIVPSSVSLEERIGMRIRCIEYYLTLADGAWPALATGDLFRFGFSFLATQPSAGNMPNTPGVIDYNAIGRFDVTAVGVQYSVEPIIVKDLSKRFPDGILIHPANLYWWNYVPNQIGAPTAFYVYINVYYTMEDISEDVWEDMWKQVFVSQAG